MPDAFDESKADFSRMNPDVRLVIADVLHKTFINVDEKGTKAGAVTKVEMAPTSMPQGETVMLDRPFVYAIADNSTNLPLFIGAVTNLIKEKAPGGAFNHLFNNLFAYYV